MQIQGSLLLEKCHHTTGQFSRRLRGHCKLLDLFADLVELFGGRVAYGKNLPLQCLVECLTCLGQNGLLDESQASRLRISFSTLMASLMEMVLGSGALTKTATTLC